MNPAQETLQWGELRPFIQAKDQLIGFPVNAFPPVIADFVMAVSEATQTMPDMASVVALGILSVCNQRKFQVFDRYVEPLSLYTVLIAEPGERKSAVLQHFTQFLQEYQTFENKQRQESINRYQVQKDVLENQIKSLKENKKQSGGDLQEDLMEKMRELQELEEVHPLRLFCDDCSAEALVGLLQKNDGIMSVISAEGGIFDIIAGRYNTKPNLDVFLKGHTGEELRAYFHVVT